ncbi:polyphenol oxidase, chloroplastic-like [Benincasa hispida]|uniref:polyphenol oxidase, chloroplastic-like n=1 Tax=Benincasa hispida TaxID=102211 RepID=UPI0018FF6FB9|nr:polyphenol oxidase, chloroplastic-like [Benincasa hispida]
MASLSTPMPLALPSATTTTTAGGGASFGPFCRNKKVPSSTIHKTNKLVITCSGSNGNANGEKSNNSLWPGKFIDRREALIGLGGLYGTASSTFGADPFALADPVETPDPAKCHVIKNLTKDIKELNCCPPSTDNVKPFLKLRVRKAAQSLDKEYIEKYKEAVALMRALPDDDPRSFKQQADVHCAYCNGGYNQLGFSVELQVHFSWLFFPFHRYYLYFHERILGSLIKDPDFALPFWNYDAPEGMEIPKIFTDESSSLYDAFRDGLHQPPTLVVLDYNKIDPDVPRQTQIDNNLTIMHRQVVSGATTPLLFFGQPYRSGKQPNPGMGTVENIPHTPIHVWTGDRNQSSGIDMGAFFSAARDPIFYAHHANVDRFWTIWKTLGGKRRDIKDTDFLNASFIFYDENCEAVRVYVKDCLDTRALGYVYDDTVKIPWLETPPTPRVPRKTKKLKKKSVGQMGKLPSVLDKIVRFEVKRPKKSRSKKEKEDEEEILVIDGIEFDGNKCIKFDVFINDEDDTEIRANNSEFAGSFVNLPHAKGSSMKINTSLRLGISKVLEDLNADDDDNIIVTLVPRFGDEPPIIQDIRIEYDA